MNGFLDTAALQLRAAANELAADNAEASRVADRRDWAELDRLLHKHGICNVIGIAADLVADMAGEHEEGSPAEADYTLAQQVLDAAARACDLTYGSCPVRFRESRARAVESVITLAQEIAP